MQAPYSRYAAIYDRTGQHKFGVRMADMALDWLNRQGAIPGTALDLATGTGAVALRLASRGIQVTGLDRSEAMLAEARTKSTAAGTSIAWRRGDMREFRISEPVDLIACFFDSINYLLEEDDLRACFGSVYANLKPGGWFVFDVNPIHRYATDWNESRDIAYSDDTLLCLFRSTYDPQTHRSPLVLSVFEREPGEPDLWRRWDETHIERGYPLVLITRLLDEAGLRVEAMCDLDEKTMQLGGIASETSMRAVFFARRPHPGGKIPA